MVKINMGAFRGGPRGPRSPFFCEILRYLQRILNKIDTASLRLASLCCIFLAFLPSSLFWIRPYLYHLSSMWHFKLLGVDCLLTTYRGSSI